MTDAMTEVDLDPDAVGVISRNGDRAEPDTRGFEPVVDDAPPSHVQHQDRRARRLRAWADAGATSVPAMVIALGSALAGTFTMALRRRRRR